VIKLYIGVVSIQGAVSEHVEAVNRAAAELGLRKIHVIPVRKLEQVSGLIIPGGESTTISKLLVKFGLYDRIIARATNEDLPILGTCAGCIVLAKKGDSEVNKTETQLLKLMDMRVSRNAFGRQRESFESDIDIQGFTHPYHAVFIRAPAIDKVWSNCQVLARLEDKIILAQQGNLLAGTFHPELTTDMRLHKYFLELV
jgi:5'-phosphate synthase pdxT subunit